MPAVSKSVAQKGFTVWGLGCGWLGVEGLGFGVSSFGFGV